MIRFHCVNCLCSFLHWTIANGFSKIIQKNYWTEMQEVSENKLWMKRRDPWKKLVNKPPDKTIVSYKLIFKRKHVTPDVEKTRYKTSSKMIHFRKKELISIRFSNDSLRLVAEWFTYVRRRSGCVAVVRRRRVALGREEGPPGRDWGGVGRRIWLNPDSENDKF